MRLPDWLRFRVRSPLETALFSAALIGFVTANLGLPLIVPLADVASHDASGAHKDKSTPFPCQNRPCGCMSADACMRSCCCFTPKERLAWARAHNVEPLPELIAAAAAEECDSHDGNGDCEHCAKAEKKAAPRNCCTAKKANQTSDAAEAAPAQQSRKSWRVVIVVGSLAARCHGMGPWSVSGFVAVPPAAAAAYAFDWSCAEDVSCDSPPLLSAIHSPPTRPPRC